MHDIVCLRFSLHAYCDVLSQPVAEGVTCLWDEWTTVVTNSDVIPSNKWSQLLQMDNELKFDLVHSIVAHLPGKTISNLAEFL